MQKKYLDKNCKLKYCFMTLFIKLHNVNFKINQIYGVH